MFGWGKRSVGQCLEEGVPHALNPPSFSSLFLNFWEGLWPTLPGLGEFAAVIWKENCPSADGGGRRWSSLHLPSFHLLRNARICKAFTPLQGHTMEIREAWRFARNRPSWNQKSFLEQLQGRPTVGEFAAFTRDKDTQKLFYGGQMRSSVREINYSVFRRITSRHSF